MNTMYDDMPTGMPQQTDRSNPKRQARRARAFVLAAALSLIPTLPAAPAVDQATLEKYDKNLNGILAHHTGQPMKRIQEDTERDYIMSPDQGKEYGIIDDVIRKRV